MWPGWEQGTFARLRYPGPRDHPQPSAGLPPPVLPHRTEPGTLRGLCPVKTPQVWNPLMHLGAGNRERTEQSTPDTVRRGNLPYEQSTSIIVKDPADDATHFCFPWEIIRTGFTLSLPKVISGLGFCTTTSSREENAPAVLMNNGFCVVHWKWSCTEKCRLSNNKPQLTGNFLGMKKNKIHPKQKWQTNHENTLKPLMSLINRSNVLLWSKELEAEELIFGSSLKAIIKMKAFPAQGGSNSFTF